MCAGAFVREIFVAWVLYGRGLCLFPRQVPVIYGDKQSVRVHVDSAMTIDIDHNVITICTTSDVNFVGPR